MKKLTLKITKYFQKLTVIFLFLIFLHFITNVYFQQRNRLVSLNNVFSNSICNVYNREYTAKSFFNFICIENPGKTFDFSLESESHICDQLYPTQHEKSLFSRLLNDFKTFKHKILYPDIKNISASCPGCHHVQIINNKLYHIPNPTAAEFQTRSRSIKTFLKLVTETFPHIRDMDLFFHPRDKVDLPDGLNDALFNVPIFGLTKTKKIRKGLRHENVILMPCFTFWSWPEARVGRWKDKLNSIVNASLKLDYEKRIPKVFWRGVLYSPSRSWLHGLTKQYPDLIDAQENTFKRLDNDLVLAASATYTTLEDHCKYKYLMHNEGGTYSSRLKYLLACGSTVIYDLGNHWEEYWYHLLEHNKNVIVFEKTGNVTALNKTLQYLIKNQDKAKEIGNQGRQLVLHYLNENAISCYWWKLLDEYGKLIKYKPTLHPKAIPIEDFLLGR